MVEQGFIERKIVIGLITNTDYTQKVREIFDAKLLTSSMARRLATWSLEFYDKYNKAPGKNIRDIFYEKLKRGLPKEVAEEIELEILPSLNEEYEDLVDEIDVKLLVDQTEAYFTEKKLEQHAAQIKALVEDGELEEAKKAIQQFEGTILKKEYIVLFSDSSIRKHVAIAFRARLKPLIYFPKALGIFWNEYFVPGGFIALLAGEKKGKTFELMDIANRGVKQENKVAFFQAGDMTQDQQIIRFAINLAKTSDQEKYCGIMYEPVTDCIYNQLNACHRGVRECAFSAFGETDFTEDNLRKEITFDVLKQAYEDNPEYKPCHNCLDFKTNRWGTPWLKKIDVEGPLEEEEAVQLFQEHFIDKKRHLMLASYSNGTLSVSIIKEQLNIWQKNDDFIPDIIIIDYADLLVPNVQQDFRHQQNEIWKNLRNLSQEKRDGVQPLVITATQADANSYEQDLLTLKNYSEDKRKFAHVTAFFGMNQSPDGREKKLGVMRYNKLVVREGEQDIHDVVCVLHNFKRGLPYLTSYL